MPADGGARSVFERAHWLTGCLRAPTMHAGGHSAKLRVMADTCHDFDIYAVHQKDLTLLWTVAYGVFANQVRND